MRMFKEERQIPGAAIVDENYIAFNVDEENVDYAVEIIVESMKTAYYLETGEILEVE